MRRAMAGGALVLLPFALVAVLPAHALEPCRIEVVDGQNGWPVPLVELRTTHHVRLVTDNAGLIAFDLPELMGRETWFDVIGHGYEAKKDGFGFRGVRLKPEPGKALKVELTRTIIAKRLGRSTGGGIFAESQKLGRELRIRGFEALFQRMHSAVHQFCGTCQPSILRCIGVCGSV